MKTAMQELIDWLKEQRDRPMGQGAALLMTQHVIAKCYECLEKEKEQIIQPVDRLCDFYGHPHIGEQMYNTRYATPILKPINK